MRRVLLLVVLVSLGGAMGFARAPELAAQAPAPRIGAIHLSSVAEWQAGRRDGLLVSNNEGGELRLVEERTLANVPGVFDSGFLKAEFPFNAVGAIWRADVPQGTSLKLEVRGGPSTDQLGDWRSLVAGDARSQSDDGALVVRRGDLRRVHPAGTLVQTGAAAYHLGGEHRREGMIEGV